LRRWRVESSVVWKSGRRGDGSRRCDAMDAAVVGELDSLLANHAAGG
jgi:hypothetical protein